MRGTDIQQSAMFSYLSPEQRVPASHPLRAIRQITDGILRQLSKHFSRMYARVGRPPIPPEKLLRALLLQILYTIRSERILMEQLNYNLLFRWFVGLNLDDEVWDVTVFTRSSGILCVNGGPLGKRMQAPSVLHGLRNVDEAAIG